MTPEQWIRSLEPPILVVGNGVLPGRIPEEKYETIIRINNFYLGRHSGEKVTHWVASGYKDIEKRLVAPVLIPWSKGYQRRKSRYDLMFGERINTETIHLERDDHILRWWPKALIKWIYFPSVGFCLLSWLNTRRIQPDIAGFDGMTTGHHADPRHRHGHDRTKGKEWEIIRTYFIKQNLNEIIGHE